MAPRARRQRDPKLRSSLLLALADAGYDALGVADGKRALEIIATRPPDATVANIALPHVAGDSLLGWARARLGDALLAGILIAATLRSELLRGNVGADAAIGAPLDPGTTRFAPRSSSAATGRPEQQRDVLRPRRALLARVRPRDVAALHAGRDLHRDRPRLRRGEPRGQRARVRPRAPGTDELKLITANRGNPRRFPERELFVPTSTRARRAT